MKTFIVTLFLSVLFSVSSFAEPVEIYYFDKQEAYRLDGFEGDTPNLVKVDETEVAAYEGVRHGAWWVKGDLPRVAGKAMALADYRTKRVANLYTERFQPRRYSVSVRSNSHEDLFLKDLAGPNTNLVIGWEVDGALKDFQVIRAMDASTRSRLIEKWYIPESFFGGRPVCWLVDNGKVVSIDSARPWDRALFGETVSIDELAHYQSPERGLTVLHYAAANGDLELARSLIAANKKLVREFDKDDWSPLSAAVENGRSAVVELLLESKAPLSDGWEGFDSIVRKAATAGHFECVKWLAPGKPKGPDGRWHYSGGAADALNENYQDIAIYLIEKGADFKIKKERRGDFALAKAAQGYPELALRLLEKFKLEPTYESDGQSLLHSVASYGDVDLLRSVMNLGVPIDGITESGLLPVDFAVGRGNVDAICWFLDNGGRDKLGERSIDPLKHAIAEKQLSSVECLIGYGFDVNKEVSPGVSPLMYAVLLEQYDIAEALVAAGGIWLMDSMVFDAVLGRLVRADEAELFRTIVGQGWEESRLVSGTFDIASVAGFFAAEKIQAVLETLGWKLEGSTILKVSDAETKASLAAPFRVDYPLHLQERFGSRSVAARIALSAKGVPLLVAVESTPGEAELAGIVEKAVYSMRFKPASKDGIAMPVRMKIKIPLQVEFDPQSVMSMAEVQEKPGAIEMVNPTYPQELLYIGAKGKVVVEFILLRDGSVRRARAASYSHSAFVKAAIECVVKSKWQPAKHNGQPVACRVRIPIAFSPRGS